MGPGRPRLRAIGADPASRPHREQRDEIEAIARDLTDKHRALRDQIWDQERKLQDLYDQDPPDPKAVVGKAYEKAPSVRRQVLEQGLEARSQALQLLTDDQRQRRADLARYRGGHR